MAPKLAAWHAELAPAVKFLKFDCNKENAVVGKALGIKVAPTFHLYRCAQCCTYGAPIIRLALTHARMALVLPHSKSVQLAVLTGAKEDALRELIEQHRVKA